LKSGESVTFFTDGGFGSSEEVSGRASSARTSSRWKYRATVCTLPGSGGMSTTTCLTSR